MLGSEDIVDRARVDEREIRLGAEDYADEILSTFELNLTKFIPPSSAAANASGAGDEPAAVE